jgi:hypothetical protein
MHGSARISAKQPRSQLTGVDFAANYIVEHPFMGSFIHPFFVFVGTRMGVHTSRASPSCIHTGS